MTIEVSTLVKAIFSEFVGRHPNTLIRLMVDGGPELSDFVHSSFLESNPLTCEALLATVARLKTQNRGLSEFYRLCRLEQKLLALCGRAEVSQGALGQSGELDMFKFLMSKQL